MQLLLSGVASLEQSGVFFFFVLETPCYTWAAANATLDPGETQQLVVQNTHTSSTISC